MAAPLSGTVFSPERLFRSDDDSLAILELRIEEKFRAQARQDQNAPNGHSVNIDAKVAAFF